MKGLAFTLALLLSSPATGDQKTKPFDIPKIPEDVPVAVDILSGSGLVDLRGRGDGTGVFLMEFPEGTFFNRLAYERANEKFEELQKVEAENDHLKAYVEKVTQEYVPLPVALAGLAIAGLLGAGLVLVIQQQVSK